LIVPIDVEAGERGALGLSAVSAAQAITAEVK
jgi:hypothetical protein